MRAQGLSALHGPVSSGNDSAGCVQIINKYFFYLHISLLTSVRSRLYTASVGLKLER